jgi:plastocyanin
MRARALLVILAAALVLAIPAIAAAPITVNIEFSDYRPDQLDVLPGETVTWTNVSERTHTVTSDTRLFDSGNVAGGARFSFTFTQPGSYRYHCTIHPSIVGEVDVRRVTLDSLPPAALTVGTPVEFSGRTATPAEPVIIQRRVSGTAFENVASIPADAEGNWKTTIPATATGDYRASTGTDASEIRRLLVETRRLIVRPTRNGVSITVAPSAPYSRFLVEIYLRERFGWWPIASGRVNYVSVADVRIARPARVRIVLVDKDGWTPLVTSKPLVLR